MIFKPDRHREIEYYIRKAGEQYDKARLAYDNFDKDMLSRRGERLCVQSSGRSDKLERLAFERAALAERVATWQQRAQLVDYAKSTIEDGHCKQVLALYYEQGKSVSECSKILQVERKSINGWRDKIVAHVAVILHANKAIQWF